MPTPIPSCSEMTRHDVPAARSVATCAASTVARGRPNRFLRLAMSRRTACTRSVPATEPNPASGRNTRRWDDVPDSASAVPTHLSVQPNCLTFPRSRTANRRLKPIRAGQRTYRSHKQWRGVLMLNVAAPRVAPACGTTSGTPRLATGGRSEAAPLNAVGLEKRNKTGKLIP